MKLDYQKTILSLKESGMIHENDKYALCLFRTESESNGVTTTMITSKVDYLMIANHDEIKLLEIDKKTGEYLDHCFIFKKENMVYQKKIKERNFIWASKGLFGGINIAIHFIAESFVHDYLIPKKMNGYEQTSERLELFTLIKDAYNTYYETLEKTYKNKI